MRLYSVYGPLEDSSRLIPNLIRQGLVLQLPEFVRPNISRDFIYIDDVTAAFVQAAVNLQEEDYGHSFNIGTGRKTTIAEVANLGRRIFNIPDEPRYTMTDRQWDVADWYAQPDRAHDRLKWASTIALEDGLRRTATWTSSLPDLNLYEKSSKKYLLDTQRSVSAPIVACYKDGQAIPVMYSRLKEAFQPG